MRPLSIIGLVVLVLGVVSFFVPLPVNKTRELKARDATVGITTHREVMVSPVVGGVLCAAGVVLLLAGSRKPA
jgi:hypothetical protein